MSQLNNTDDDGRWWSIGYTTERKIIRVLQAGLLTLLLGYILVPLYWMITSSFKTREQLFTTPPPLVPYNPTLAHYEALFTETMFLRFIFNSVVISIGTVILTVILATLAGYGLTRSSFRGHRSLARLVLFSYMFPPILLGIPLYILFHNLNLLNSYLGLIIGLTAVTLPFCTWLMWQYFQTIPISYEESAWVFGASRLYAFRKVVLPMAIPGLIAISIFAFAISWSNFTIGVIIITEQSMKPFAVALPEFIGQIRTNWGYINAGGVIVLIPAFLFVFFLQKYIIKGFRIGR